MGDPASFLSPADLAMLQRILDEITPPSASDLDRETRATVLVTAFQAGVRDEAELVRRMTTHWAVCSDDIDCKKLAK